VKTLRMWHCWATVPTGTGHAIYATPGLGPFGFVGSWAGGAAYAEDGRRLSGAQATLGDPSGHRQTRKGRWDGNALIAPFVTPPGTAVSYRVPA